MNTFNQTLDARGHDCPLPIINTCKPFNSMSVGEALQFIAIDTGAVKDISAFYTQTGNELASSEEQKEKRIFVIRKA